MNEEYDAYDGARPDQRKRDVKACARAAKHQDAREAALVREMGRRAALSNPGDWESASDEAQSGAGACSGASPEGTTAATTAASQGSGVRDNGLEGHRRLRFGESDGSGSAAGEAVLRGEVGTATGAAATPPGGADDTFLRGELGDVRCSVAPEQLRSCTPQGVQVLISASRIRTVLLKAFFPAGYPASPLAVELRAATGARAGPRGGGGARSSGASGGGALGGESSGCGASDVRLCAQLLAKLQAGLDAELRRHAGRRQVLPAVQWLQDCLTQNRLAAAYDEVRHLRAMAASGAGGGTAGGGRSRSVAAGLGGCGSESGAATVRHGSGPSGRSSSVGGSGRTPGGGHAARSSDLSSGTRDGNTVAATAATTTAESADDGKDSDASGSGGGAGGSGSQASTPPAATVEVLTVRERSGVVEVRLSCGGYWLELRAVVPEQYPDEGVGLEVLGSNLPGEAVAGMVVTAADMVRRLSAPPLIAPVYLSLAREGAGTGTPTSSSSASPAAASRGRRAAMTVHSQARADALAAAAQEAAAERQAARAAAAAAHEPQPSLLAALEFLREACVGALGGSRCGVCRRRLLPADPGRLGQVPAGMGLLRLAGCGHFVHHKCIESFLAEPPFGRCGCPVPDCGKRISHHQLVTDPRVLEARWAGRQARQREIADAASMLGDMGF